MGSELGCETEDDLVVDPLEEVFLGRLGDESVDVAEGVLFISEAVVGRDDDVAGVLLGSLVLVLDGEVHVVVLQVVVVGELVAAQDEELLAVDGQLSVGVEVPGGHVFLLVHLPRLVEGELLVQFLSF